VTDNNFNYDFENQARQLAEQLGIEPDNQKALETITRELIRANAAWSKPIEELEYDELAHFLSYFHYIYPNLNDTFARGGADTEQLSLELDFYPPNQADIDEGIDGWTAGDMLINIWRKFGHKGIVAYVSEIRGQEPEEYIVDANYLGAKHYLRNSGWKHEEY
jgi:hypothetical protein